MEQILKVKDTVINILKVNKKLVLKILAVLIAIIAVLVIASVLKKDDVGNTAGNVSNHGISATAGKWIYYIGFEDDEPYGIYRVKRSGEKTEKIASGSFQYLNVLGNYIYCLELDEDDDEINLIKMKTNGEKKEILAKNVDEGPVTAVGNMVYYIKDGSLYRIKKDGSDREKISSKDISYYQVQGDMIYYIYESDGNSYIAKMEEDGEDNVRIGKLEDAEYVALQVKGSNVYYITAEMNDDYKYEYKLYKMNKKGEKEEKICSLPNDIEIANMQEDAIYYVTEEYDICTIDYKAGNKETIKKVDDDVYSINVSENWVFFVTENEDADTIIKRITTKGEKEQTL